MRTSIRQVAQHANVSPKTVTNVLRDRDARTAASTRERVMQSVRELNYVPVRSASQNRRTETRVIGMSFNDLDPALDYHAVQTFAGCRTEANERGYDLLIYGACPSWAADRTEVRFLDNRIDGLILFGAPDLEKLCDTLIENRVHTVCCYSSAAPPAIPFVVPDNRRAMRDAVHCLASAGHTKIGCIAGGDIYSDALERRIGFQEAVASLDGLVQTTIAYGCWEDDDKNRQAADQMLDSDVTAVVCGNDGQAIVLWDRAIERGLRVPDDLSITGMDNSPEAAIRGLTSIINPFRTIGRKTVSVLLELINGADPSTLSERAPTELILRGSVAPRRAANV